MPRQPPFYGSRSASGVIIVTTKKGRIGKPVVNVAINKGAVNELSYNKVLFAIRVYTIPPGFGEAKLQTYGVNATTSAYEVYQTGTTEAGLLR